MQLSTSVFEMVSSDEVLDEQNVKAGIRMAVGDDKIADFTIDNYAAL